MSEASGAGTPPPAGWYDDPEREGAQRYWDGSSWTEHRSPHARDAPPGYYPDPTAKGSTDVYWRWDGRMWVDGPSRGTALTQWINGETSASQPGNSLESRLIGGLSGKAMEEVRRNCSADELPEFIVGERGAGGLAAFQDRCIIVKRGTLTGITTGTWGGGRVATFMYGQITGVEFNSGWVTGVLEILTPSYQGTANKDFWRGTFSGRNANSNDPYTLSNCLPLNKATYEQARPQIDYMRQMIAATQAGTASVGSVSASSSYAAAPELSTEIRKLAELREQGGVTP